MRCHRPRRRPGLLAGLPALLVALGPAGAFAAPPSDGTAPAFGPSTPSPQTGSASGGTPAPPKHSADAAMTPEAAYARATAFYESGQYVECANAFAVLLDDEALAGGLAFRSREQARVYRAACLIAQGKSAAADDQFRAAIRESPQMAVPNAIVFPQAVVERFIIVRSGLLEEISRSEAERAEREREAAAESRRRALAERQRVIRLERLASEETVVLKNRRWVAFAPFGIGQFQNRDYGLGAVFLASETILLGTAVTAVSIELSLHSQAKGGFGVTPDDAKFAQLNKNIQTANDVSLIATGALALVVTGGILEANLSFVPEFNGGVRPRPKPVAPRAGFNLLPLVGPTVGGAEMGLMGRF